MNDFKTMHLFAGHGGGLLADLILGHTPVVAVEWDAYACQVLRERSADGWFPGLQVWEGDVRLFDPSEYAGQVDCIHAGFPCQDISVAGKQAGVSEGTRSGLYREVLRIAGVVRPKQLFLENVAAILSNGLGTVLGDLAALGYDSRWLCIRASDVGAPHHRDRWFLLANTNSEDGGTSSLGQNTGANWRHESSGMGEVLADSDLSSWVNVLGDKRTAAQQHEPSKCSSLLSDTDGERLQGPHKQSSKQGIWNGATGLCETEFTSYWSTESFVGRVANGIPNRVHRLKGLGNAQVPLQAAAAWKLLGGV
jgi:DNA (cytosine-5)-methyltransferase 1